MKLALKYKKLTLFKVLSKKKYTKLTVISIVIVNVLFTLFIVKYVTYSMLGLRMTNFAYGGTIINVIKRSRRKVVLPKKLLSSAFLE